MTIAGEADSNETTGNEPTIAAEDVLAAVKAAGVTDPSVAQQIAENLTKPNGNGGSDKQTKTPKDGAEAIEVKGTVPAISENAMVVLEKRYLRKNDDGEIIENPSQMFRRVARAIAEAELFYNSKADVAHWEEAFYEPMARMEFVPNSPTLMNAGTGAGTLSACFVIGLEDSMEGIMETAKEAALVQKFGGGTGFALSNIRPKGAPISTTHGRACGPVAVLRHLSSVSTLVTQGGKRDGANMAVMDVHHPDIMDFITCKTTEGQIHNFNISVGASDEFMQSVDRGENYELRDPRTGQVVGKAERRGRLHQDYRRGVAQRRTRHNFPGRGQPRQPHTPRRPHDRYKPVRRAAPAAVRVLQPGIHQPRQVRGGQRPPAHGGLGWPERDRAYRHTLPGQRHRRQRLLRPGD